MTSEDTFETWVKDYSHMVGSLCNKVIRNRDAALDASQSTWELVYRHKDSFRNESGAGTWIFKIAYREALRVAKKEKASRYKNLHRSLCKCGLAGRINDTSFKREVLAIKAITDKARFIHEAGSPLPTMDYWKTIRENCHKKDLTSL